MKIVIFNAVSGFGNRLLPIVSIYTWAKQHDVRMGIIWNQRTHRSGLPQDQTDHLISMKDYFNNIPAGIDVFKDRASALKHYSLDDDDLADYDMQWQPFFDRSYLSNDYLYIHKCCHLISLFSGNESIVGQRADLSPDNQAHYTAHPYIKLVKHSIREFGFPRETKKIGEQLFRKNMTGLQLRNTDGGFTVNSSEDVINNMHSLIENSECVYFSNDRESDLDLVMKRHKNVVAYQNSEKFLNNDLGSLYSLVDLYVLSRCNNIRVAARSSFGLIAHLFSENATIDYWI